MLDLPVLARVLKKWQAQIICRFEKTLAPVVQKVHDNAIHLINFYPVDSAILVSLILIYWIVIYPVDSALQHLNNRDQVFLNKVWNKQQVHLIEKI